MISDPTKREDELAGKTLGVVGLGGIGREVGRLAGAIGMRVIATRRSAERRSIATEGVDELYPAEELPQLLPLCHFVAVFAQWLPQPAGHLD